MKMLKLTSLALVLLAAAMSAGCTMSNPNLPDPGFTLVTVRRNNLGIETPVPGTVVSGSNTRPAAGDAIGKVKSFGMKASSSPSGLIPIKDGFAPAFWTFKVHNGRCFDQEASGGVKRAEFNYLICGPLDRISLPFAFAPLRRDAEAATTTFTITGDNMRADYGMPTLQFYDVNGVLMCQTQATSIAWNNSSIEGSTYPLDYMPSGVYIVEIWNATPDGSGEYVGSTSMNVFRTSELPPDADGDGYRADVDCNDGDPSIYPNAPTSCASGEDRNCSGLDDYEECYEGGLITPDPGPTPCPQPEPDMPAMDCGPVN